MIDEDDDDDDNINKRNMSIDLAKHQRTGTGRFACNARSTQLISDMNNKITETNEITIL